MNTHVNVDEVLKTFGVKYVFIESGHHSIIERIEAVGFESDEEASLLANPPKFWCELSWGSADEDRFDAATNAFGETLGEAMKGCLDLFVSLVREGNETYVEIAQHFGIHEKILRDS